MHQTVTFEASYWVKPYSPDQITLNVLIFTQNVPEGARNVLSQ